MPLGMLKAVFLDDTLPFSPCPMVALVAVPVSFLALPGRFQATNLRYVCEVF